MTSPVVTRKPARNPRGRPPLEEPTPIDLEIGRRIRLTRTLRGMSQEALGRAVGLTFQQVQKYEKGSNRISASRLYQFATALGVNVADLFFETPSPSAGGASTGGMDAKVQDTQNPSIPRRETIELVRAYYSIHNEDVRQGFHSFVDLIARQSAARGR